MSVSINRRVHRRTQLGISSTKHYVVIQRCSLYVSQQSRHCPRRRNHTLTVTCIWISGAVRTHRKPVEWLVIEQLEPCAPSKTPTGKIGTYTFDAALMILLFCRGEQPTSIKRSCKAMLQNAWGI